MISLSDHIRKIAKKTNYEIEEIKIFFSAPKPERPSSETLNIEKGPAQEANFQWIAYQVLFTKNKSDYYIYNISLNPDGKEKGPAIVFPSDSDWSGENKNRPAKDITPGDIKRAFPKVLKGPNLFPLREYQTVYVNTHESDKGKSYSGKEFKKFFDNDFYVVVSKSKELKNPFGKLIGMKYPKEEEK